MLMQLNGAYEAETLQLYKYRQVLWGVSKFFRYRVSGGAGPPSVNLRHPILSRKLLEL